MRKLSITTWTNSHLRTVRELRRLLKPARNILSDAGLSYTRSIRIGAAWSRIRMDLGLVTELLSETTWDSGGQHDQADSGKHEDEDRTHYIIST